MRGRSKLIQQCGLCARWTHDGDHIPSGNRDPETGITPMDNFVCWRCEGEARGAFMLMGRPAETWLLDRRERPHLGSRIHHGRTCSRPARPSAAAGPADTAPAAAADLRRGVGRIRIGRIRIRPVAAIAATTCGAGRCTARCAMAKYWCCASSHVADDTGRHRRFQALTQSDFAPMSRARGY